MDKNALRDEIKLKRKQLSQKGVLDNLSNIICNNILNSQLFNNSIHIALYSPLDCEINITGIMSATNKFFYFPVCKDNVMKFARYTGEFIKGSFNINEPTGEIVNPSILDVIYIPALCCNNECYRLGYGKGFYDRFFFINNIKAKKVIVCADCFVTNKFIQEEHDIQCDLIMTEKSI